MKKKAAKGKAEPKWRKAKSRKEGAKVPVFAKKEKEADKKPTKSTEPIAEKSAVAAEGCQAPVGNGVCGGELAPGQTSVCGKHVRTN